MAELMCNPLTSLAFTPRGMMKLSFDMMQLSAAAVRWLAPWRETRRGLQEFENKLEAFNLFVHVDSVLANTSQGEVYLPELIGKAQALEPYRAVWATEGLGYYLATRISEQGEAPRNLLNDRREDLPARSLAALHAGMGLAIANRLMKTIRPRSHESEIRRVLDQFVMVCRENSRADYVGAAYESLGLVGRGMYFAPTNFLPDGNSGRAVKMTCQEPPHELGRRNALAGLAWAITLVNIRHPEILESFLKHHGHQLGDRDAFINGVSSSVMIWRDSTVDDPSLETFCNYQPDSSDRTLVERWEEMVRRPCLRALEHVYPALKARRRLGEVFHCHDAMAG